MKRRIPLAPQEGWLTLGLVLLICLTLAWSVDGVRWVLGRDEYLDFLVLAATGGVLAGFIGAKVGWGRWLTFLIGSIFAALIVPLLTGLLQYPDGASLHDLYEVTAEASVAAYIDIVVLGKVATAQYLHHVMSIGLLIWGTSMFASFAVFGHHRSLNAVVVVGVVLVGNMAFTRENQLSLLVLFSLAALFLLIRAHVYDEQSEWLRRRIGDPASISTVYLRGGTTFIAITVAASFLLTQTASSAPLAGAWGGLGDGLIGLSRAVSRYLPTGGSTRSIGVTFGSGSVVKQVWESDPSPAFTVTRDPSDKRDYYWRAITSDFIDLTSWSQSRPTQVDRPAGTSVFDQLADDVDEAGRHSVTVTVTPDGFRDALILSPETPVKVNQDVRLEYVGQGGYFSRLDRGGGTGPYTVTALVSERGDEPGQVNTTALRATDTDYPQDIDDLYTQTVPGSLGKNALLLRDKVRNEAFSSAPVDLANELYDELRSSAYFYTTDVRDLPCGGLSSVECFATYKRGFCQYYAITMAVILRDLGVPTRIAEGFLPGSRQGSPATELVRNSNAHAWVEVYFNGFGWVAYDPTGAGLPTQIGPMPSGRPAAASPSASGSARPAASRRDPRELGELDPGGTGAAGGLGPGGVAGPLIAVTVLLLLVVGGLALAVWQRGPRGATTADGAYGMVTRTASRFGFGPRPTQTVYEFAGALGDVLPDVRPELETVARAKVESVYARQILGEERLESLRAAQRRLRVGLLRLLFRRRQRRRRR
ncbi:MAG: hypothetical protein A2Z32_11195 [Chloroflexi bacterium RBG_16_69_14]|nr:MAG: hypothetical protein A2Z32_11195 [Chloroflexi bacterium RBG_16_69_14]